ncbi:MAG TPA: haloalkane dehalogenase [Burkholderiaceae bacterium]|nr:haloalkane dehalogenase [Burkholderiaceae bacterium]
MDLLRTPEARFDAVPDFDFPVSYVDDLPGYEGLRVAYVDTGPGAGGETFLCLHGQPTWSFLYRKMTPAFVRAGHRVIAPDLAGFGRSDKPVDDAVYTFDFHRDLLLALLGRLDATNLTLVCQDWGGLLGLTLPMEMPERFTGLVVMNTTLGTGDAPLTPGFLDWRAYVARTPDLDCGRLLARSVGTLSAAEAAAYEAPFPDARHKAGVRRFPQLVPDAPDAPGAAISRRARDWWSRSWSGRTLMAIGEADPVLGPPVMEALRGTIRGCPPPMRLPAAGHFVQEWGEPIAEEAVRRWRAGA